MACDPTRQCPLCDQRGLPLFPVRYAVARKHDVHAAATAPDISGAYVAPEIKLPDTANYTLRMLRSGYLYTYNEKRREWKAYVVGEHGHLLEFAPDGPAPSLNNVTPCARMAQSQSGMFIVIPDAHRPELLGEFWLVFSPVPWTRSTWHKHQSRSYRQTHMRLIDLAAWVAGQGQATQPHLQSLYSAQAVLSEFALAGERPEPGSLGQIRVRPGADPFAHALTSLRYFHEGQVDALLHHARTVSGQQSPDSPGAVPPAMVALDDPIAMTAEVNQLSLELMAEWETQDERMDKRTSAQMIVAIREAIKNGALEDEKYRRRDRELVQRTLLGWVGGSAARQVMVPLEQWDDDWFAVEDEAQMLRLGEASWRKYGRQLRSADACDVYLAQLQQEREAHARRLMEPLDRAYLAWLDSEVLRRYMRSQFDPKNVRCGLHYQEAMATILQDACSRTLIARHVEQALQADVSDADALVMRALVWNQDEAAAAWKRVSSSTPSASDLSGFASGVYNALKDVVEAGAAGQLEGAFGGMAKYILNLSAPVTSLVSKAVAAASVSASAALPHRMQLGLVTALIRADNPSMEIVSFQVQTTPKRAQRALALHMSERSGRRDPRASRGAAREVLRRGGAPNSGPLMRFPWVALVDRGQPGQMEGASKRMLNSRLQRAYTAHDLQDLMRRHARAVGSGAGTQLVGGMGAMMLQAVSMGFMYQEIGKASGSERTLKVANFGAGVAATIGVSLEAVGAAGEKLPWLSQRLDRPMGRWMGGAATRAAAIKAAGRWLTGPAGVVLGAMQVAEGVRDYGVSWWYGSALVASGAFAAVSTLLFFMGSAVPIAFVLAIAAAIIAIVAAWLKPDEVEFWLNKARHFGKNNRGSFESVESQGLALKAIGAN